MQKGQALLELLVVMPLIALLVALLGVLVSVVQTAHLTTDGLKEALWFSDEPVRHLTERSVRPTDTDDPLMPVWVEQSGRLLREDGWLAAGEPFHDAIMQDSLILPELGLELTQASVELLRRLGSPMPFREVSRSAITSVGVVGHRDMALPSRINVYD